MNSDRWQASEVGDVAATVVVPTHDHGPLLTLSVRSALEQSVDAIEVFIVCDGASEDTRHAAEELRASDERVRVFAYDKGPRNGEAHRHLALQEATGTIVCYLSDDDLWLADHVATMTVLLESADFAHAYPIGIDADGEVFSWPGHLSLPAVRRSMMEGWNFIPLPCAAHTLELYRRLPNGWHTTPAGTYTDLYMWQQILEVEGVRLASGDSVTVLHFPSSLRGDNTIEERLAELAQWSAASREPAFAEEINRRARENLAIEWARADVHTRDVTGQLSGATNRLTKVETDLAAASDRLDQLGSDLRSSEAERAQLLADREALAIELAQADVLAASSDERIAELSERLAWMTGSRTWRTRAALLRIPGVAWLLRKAGAARSR